MTRHSWHDPHMVRTGRSLLRALYFTLGGFLFLFVLLHIGGALYVSSLAGKTLESFNNGLAKDTSFLKEHGDAIALDSKVSEYITTHDAEHLLQLIQEETKKYSLGPVGVADSNGVIISRNQNLGVHGDNVFLTIPEGRVVSHGQSVENVGQGTIDPKQVRLSTGRPVLEVGRMIGAVFTTFVMDDAYARRFRDAYLRKDVEVLFYNKEHGVFGDSFQDEALRKVVNSYFDSGSDWIQNGLSEKTVSFNDNKLYLVENVIFPSLEAGSVGALVFIPRQDISLTANLTIAFLTLIIFLLFVLHHRVRARGEEKGWRYSAAMMLVSFVIFPVAFFALHLQNTGFLTLSRIPYVLYNSTLRLQPEFGIYDTGFEQKFSVVADTGDEVINAVQIKLLFDPGAVELKALEEATSTCAYVVEKKIDNQLGTADLSCVLMKSEGERGSLPIAMITVVPRRAGSFALSFDSEDTKVLASDGLGTNVLRMAQAGNYRVDNFNTAEATTNTGRTFVVFSPSHPNQSRWYNTPTARFVWRGKLDAVYVYEFDNLPDTIPSQGRTIKGSEVSIPVPGDGIFYFHLRLASGGPTAHYRIEADRTPPEIASMDLSAQHVIAGDVVRFSFKAKDSASGIQRNYYVDLGNHLFLPIGPQLFIPFLEAGEQKVVLRVYDDAGNYSEASQTITVEASR